MTEPCVVDLLEDDLEGGGGVDALLRDEEGIDALLRDDASSVASGDTGDGDGPHPTSPLVLIDVDDHISIGGSSPNLDSDRADSDGAERHHRRMKNTARPVPQKAKVDPSTRRATAPPNANQPLSGAQQPNVPQEAQVQRLKELTQMKAKLDALKKIKAMKEATSKASPQSSSFPASVPMSFSPMTPSLTDTSTLPNKPVLEVTVQHASSSGKLPPTQEEMQQQLQYLQYLQSIQQSKPQISRRVVLKNAPEQVGQPVIGGAGIAPMGAPPTSFPDPQQGIAPPPSVTPGGSSTSSPWSGGSPMQLPMGTATAPTSTSVPFAIPRPILSTLPVVAPMPMQQHIVPPTGGILGTSPMWGSGLQSTSRLGTARQGSFGILDSSSSAFSRVRSSQTGHEVDSFTEADKAHPSGRRQQFLKRSRDNDGAGWGRQKRMRTSGADLAMKPPHLQQRMSFQQWEEMFKSGRLPLPKTGESHPKTHEQQLVDDLQALQGAGRPRMSAAMATS